MDSETHGQSEQPVDLRAATHAAVLRATDPTLESLMESILKSWQETIERRQA